VELRPKFTSGSEDLQQRLAVLVRERQALRDQQASHVVLERNRLHIVQAQLELSRALVWEHAEARVA
jgi:hypothetical protein